jgi:hypothetical protein
MNPNCNVAALRKIQNECPRLTLNVWAKMTEVEHNKMRDSAKSKRAAPILHQMEWHDAITSIDSIDISNLILISSRAVDAPRRVNCGKTQGRGTLPRSPRFHCIQNAETRMKS